MVPIILTSLGSVVFLVTAKKLRSRYKRRQIPQCRGQLPLLGRVDVVKVGRHGRAHAVWEEMYDEAERLDAPFMQFSVFGINTVLACSAAAADAVLRKTGFHPKEKNNYKGFLYIGTKVSAILEMRNEAEHERLRRGMTEFFCQENVDTVARYLEQDMRAECERIAKKAAGTPEGAAVVDVVVLAEDFMVNAVTKALFEIDYKLDMTYFKDAHCHMGEMAGNTMAINANRCGITPGYLRYRRNWRGNHRQWREIMQMVYEREEQPKSRAFWMCLRRLFPKAMTDRAQWDEALANTAIMFAASTENTQNAIGNTLTALSLHKESLQMLETELADAGLLATPDNPAPMLPDAAELRKLRVLDAVFHESMRTLPPAQHGTMRELARDVTVEGVTVPKGSIVMVSPWGLHHSKRIWGPSAKTWDVGMWLEGRSMRDMKRDAQGVPRWQPFGDGPQSCIGSHLATLEVKMALAAIVGRFHIEADSSLRYKSVDQFIHNCTGYLTLTQPYGLPLRMRPRVAPAQDAGNPA